MMLEERNLQRQCLKREYSRDWSGIRALPIVSQRKSTAPATSLLAGNVIPNAHCMRAKGDRRWWRDLTLADTSAAVMPRLRCMEYAWNAHESLNISSATHCRQRKCWSGDATCFGTLDRSKNLAISSPNYTIKVRWPWSWQEQAECRDLKHGIDTFASTVFSDRKLLKHCTPAFDDGRPQSFLYACQTSLIQHFQE
jgi:hypothetical protein